MLMATQKARQSINLVMLLPSFLNQGVYYTDLELRGLLHKNEIEFSDREFVVALNMCIVHGTLGVQVRQETESCGALNFFLYKK